MYHFIGIKGTGMAALALMLDDLGKKVQGSDQENHYFTEDELIRRGIKILPFSVDNIKDNMTVIIGNAFLDDFDEVKAARNNKTCKCYRYHEFLGELIKDYISVAIAGSHGKTTTTTMAKTVISNFENCAYLIGDGEGYLNKDSKYICIEADEFRRHFSKYYPNYALINNIEIDHVDYFKDEDDYFNAYQEFVDNVKDVVFYNGDDKWCQKLQFKCNAYSFGFNADNDFTITNIKEDENSTSFDLVFNNEIVSHYDLPFVGDHLILDALGVISLSYILGFDNKGINEALNNYQGPKRRYVVEKYNDSILVDDYAHHPTEVKVTLEATRKRYPNRNIVAIFKPHRASRVQYFVNEFKDALNIADDIYLLDFTSIDDKQDGTDINIDYLANIMDKVTVLPENEDGAKLLSKHKGSVYVFMSSKDIYNIANDLKKYL